MKLGFNIIMLVSISGILLTLTGCSNKHVSEKSVDEIYKGDFVAGVSVHDPSIVQAKDSYYIFGSHMEAAQSKDLRKWKSIATGVNSSNRLFDQLFEPDYKAFAYVGKNDQGGYSVWAPDVIYNKAMGKYVMYFCTTSTFIKSNLCFAVADNIEGPYTYVDTLLYSGFTEDTISQINFYDIMPKATDLKKYLKKPWEFDNMQWPNCIDPTVFYDNAGKLWMVYGSWSGGIFLLEIDEETGYPIHPTADSEKDIDPYYGKRLVGGLHNSIEGPYIMYNEATQYYYLFVSYGILTREGGYQIRCFRSKNVEGPYTDAAEAAMGAVPNHSKYGLKLMGNYRLPGNTRAYMAPGHCSLFTDTDGKMYMAYHTRFDTGSEYHEPRVHQLFVTKNGWLTAAPFATEKEDLKSGGYQYDDMSGTYYLLNHESDISKDIHIGKEVKLSRKGKISGEIEGTFEIEEGTSNITIAIDEVIYQGVILDMADEAGNPTRCFSAVGSNNQTIWGVHYK